MTSARSEAAPLGDRATTVLMSLCYAMALFHRTAFQGLDGPIASEFALAPAATADLASVFFWTYLFVMIPTGLLADAIGARRVAILGCALSAGGSILFATANSAVDLTLARILIAAGSAAAFVSMMRFIAVTFPDRKATYSGRGIFVGNLGAIASGAPLVMLLAIVGWRDIWLGLAAASTVLAIALCICTATIPAPQSPPRSHEPAGELRTLIASPYIHLGVLMLAGLSGAFYAFGNLIAPRYLHAHGFNPMDSGWQVSMLILGYGLGAAFWGWIGDLEHQRTRALVVACGGALACWSAIALNLSESRSVLIPLFFMTGLCCGAFTLVYPLMTERHSPSHAGGVIACVNCGIPLGAAILQMIAGRVSQAHGSWLLVAAGCVALVAAILLLRDRQHRVRMLGAG